MKFLELPCISSMLDYIVVELIPIGDDVQFRAGKVGERVKIETVDDTIGSPKKSGDGNDIRTQQTRFVSLSFSRIKSSGRRVGKYRRQGGTEPREVVPARLIHFSG